jgi:hypothetical protein
MSNGNGIGSALFGLIGAAVVLNVAGNILGKASKVKGSKGKSIWWGK